MAETDAIETRPITFHDREIQTIKPTKEQVAVMVRLTRLKPAAETDVARQLATINRVPLLVGSMLASPDDWDWVEDGLADNTVKWEEVFDIAASILRVWFEDDADNRAERRRVAKANKVIEGTARRT